MSRKKTPEATAKTKEEIVTATARMFLRDGYEGATMKTIATEAGCTTGKLYSNFNGKEEIFSIIAAKIGEIEFETAKKSAGENAAPIAEYLFSCATILEICRLNKNLHELYRVCYTTPMTIKNSVKASNEYLRSALHECGCEYSEKELMMRGLCAAGIIGGFIMMADSAEVEFSDMLQMCLERCMEVYGINPKRSRPMVESVMERLEVVHDTAYSVIIRLLQNGV